KHIRAIAFGRRVRWPTWLQASCGHHATSRRAPGEQAWKLVVHVAASENASCERQLASSVYRCRARPWSRRARRDEPRQVHILRGGGAEGVRLQGEHRPIQSPCKRASTRREDTVRQSGVPASLPPDGCGQSRTPERR